MEEAMKARHDDGRILKPDPAVARAHELLEKFPPRALNTLWLAPPAACLGAPPEGSRFWQPHFADHTDLQGRGWESLDESEHSLWPQIVLYASKHKEETNTLLRAARTRLAEDGVLLFLVPNDYGGKSFEKALHESGALLSYENGRKSRLYRLGRGDLSSSTWDLNSLSQRPHGYVTAPGLFSWSSVDSGSALLTTVLEKESLSGPVADLGAGWGYLASQLSPHTTVHLFESDRRGLAAAVQNLQGRPAHFHWCDLTDLNRWPDGAPTRFSNVVTNPPFHSGQREETALGRLFARLAHRLLAPGGALWLVGNTHLAYPRLLATLFEQVEIKAQARGFTVVKATR